MTHGKQTPKNTDIFKTRPMAMKAADALMQAWNVHQHEQMAQQAEADLLRESTAGGNAALRVGYLPREEYGVAPETYKAVEEGFREAMESVYLGEVAPTVADELTGYATRRECTRLHRYLKAHSIGIVERAFRDFFGFQQVSTRTRSDAQWAVEAIAAAILETFEDAFDAVQFDRAPLESEANREGLWRLLEHRAGLSRRARELCEILDEAFEAAMEGFNS